MAEVIVSENADADLDRLVTFLIEHEPVAAQETCDLVLGAMDVLRMHPLLGRPAGGDLRELVISRGRTGYLALYDYDAQADEVVILAIRHQREAGYPDPGGLQG